MMGIKLKSQRRGNWIGIAIVYPSGARENSRNDSDAAGQ